MKDLVKSRKGSELANQLIRQLYFNKALSAAELGEWAGLSVPSISKILNELLINGLIIEQGLAPSSGGRRPLLYSINPSAAALLCVEMDQLSTRIQLFDLHNQPLYEGLSFNLTLSKQSGSVDILCEQIQKYIKRSGISASKIAGIGIGMPGFINVKEGINYTYLKTEGSLAAHISKVTGIDTYIDNDSSLIAFAEQAFGIAKGQTDVMVINLGWGIGLGMIIGMNLYRGHHGFAGELSHIPLSEDGALCECGKQGCLEAEASLLVMARKAFEGLNSGRISSLKSTESSLKSMGEAILDAANEGDQFSIELMSESGFKIGKALSILMHLMNPNAIILSGRGAKCAKVILAPIQQALTKYCIPRLAEGTKLLISELGFDAELLGAAALIMENFDKDRLSKFY